MGETETRLLPFGSALVARPVQRRGDGVVRQVMRPLAMLWLRRVQAELDLLPHPLDDPQQHAAGPNPDRVLLCGNGPTIGFGVLTHELALSGHLARATAARTRRGVDLDVVVQRGLTIETVTDCLHELPLRRYDAVVVTLGATDAFALLPVKRWRTAMQTLIDDLRNASCLTTPLVIVGITPIQRSTFSAGRIGDLADRHAALLNSVTKRLCASSPNCIYQAPTGTEQMTAIESASTERFARLGATIATQLAPRLDRMPHHTTRFVREALS